MQRGKVGNHIVPIFYLIFTVTLDLIKENFLTLSPFNFSCSEFVLANNCYLSELIMWQLTFVVRIEVSYYKEFHRFGQAKFPNGGLASGFNQFSILPQLPSKIMLGSKVVKIYPKIIISLH
jgi:hypothetical protein